MTGAEEQKALPLLEIAKGDLGRRLKEATKALGDPYLVRARVERPRIKSLPSLERKAAQHGWTLEETLDKAVDLVGYRVVCNNLQDVERMADLLERFLGESKIPVKRIDYVKQPKKGGYRGIHLIIRLKVQVGPEMMDVGCEVQIRSLLQHAWAELSRADIYTKEESLDPPLLRSMEQLSQVLHEADERANEIRQQISRPRRGEPPDKGAPLTGLALAFLFHRAFGEDPPDYVVEATLREFQGTPVRSDGLEAALKDETLVRRLRSAYQKYAKWKPESFQIFRWIVHATAYGTVSALRLAKNEGRADWKEIDTIGRREILSDLPETWEDLVEWLSHPAKDEDVSHDLERWADALNILDSCNLCGTPIVPADSFAQALVKHYKLRGQKAENACEVIEEAIESSGAETGYWNNHSLCSYHGNAMNRDD